MGKYRVRVCRGPTCGDKRDSASIAAEFRRLLDLTGSSEVELCWQSCYGRCSRGPNVLVRRVVDQPQMRSFSVATAPPSSGGPATMYNYVTPSDVVDIIQEHLATGRPVRRLIERARKRYEADELALEHESPGRIKVDGESE